MQVLKEDAVAGLGLPRGDILAFLLDPQLLFKVAFVLAVLPEGSSAHEKVCRKLTVGNMVQLALILWNNATSNEVSFFVAALVL